MITEDASIYIYTFISQNEQTSICSRIVNINPLRSSVLSEDLENWQFWNDRKLVCRSSLKGIKRQEFILNGGRRNMFATPKYLLNSKLRKVLNLSQQLETFDNIDNIEKRLVISFEWTKIQLQQFCFTKVHRFPLKTTIFIYFFDKIAFKIHEQIKRITTTWKISAFMFFFLKALLNLSCGFYLRTSWK